MNAPAVVEAERVSLDDLTKADDPVEAADEVLDALRIYGEPRRLIYPLVLGWARNRRRAEVRALEDAAFRHGLRRQRQPLANGAELRAAVEWEQANPDLFRLLAAQFSISGDTSYTTWGAATAEEHRTCAAYLRGMASRTMETAARHEQAAELLEKHGAATLNDLFKIEVAG